MCKPLRPFLLTACLALPCDPAQAGAWPREAGTGFALVSGRVAWPQNLQHWTSYAPTEDYQTLYLEYGLTDSWTLGMDFGRSVSGEGKLVGFLQYPLRNRDRGPKVTAQLGFGEISGNSVLRPGLSVGWGLNRGWLSFDALAEMQATDDVIDYKLDATWGRNLPNDFKVIFQVQTGLEQDDPPFVRLAPSVVTPLGERTKAEFGLTWGLTGDSSMGLMFGLWRDF